MSSHGREIWRAPPPQSKGQLNVNERTTTEKLSLSAVIRDVRRSSDLGVIIITVIEILLLLVIRLPHLPLQKEAESQSGKVSLTRREGKLLLDDQRLHGRVVDGQVQSIFDSLVTRPV